MRKLGQWLDIAGEGDLGLSRGRIRTDKIIYLDLHEEVFKYENYILELSGGISKED